MINVEIIFIEILKNWCLERTYLNIYDFHYKHSAKSDNKIILYFYSEKIEESTSFSFYLDEKEYNSIYFCKNYEDLVILLN